MTTRVAFAAKTCSECERPILAYECFATVFSGERLKAVCVKCWGELNNDV
jgi:hypothetical protein